MIDYRNNPKIDNMLFLLVEGVLDQEGIDYINNWLSSDPGATKYYCDFINDYVAMKYQVNSLIEMDEEFFSVSNEFDAELWAALADVEKTAPEVEIKPSHEKPREPIKRVVYSPQEKRKMSKSSIIFLVINAAAVLFIVLFLKFAPPKNTVEVATLTDAVNAKWSYHQLPERGIRLPVSTSDPIELQHGVIEIESDKGVNVTLQGPAGFRFISPDEIVMDYGRLYAIVSQSGTGFTVKTQNSKIIDLGTCFGVYAGTRGETELHVYKGKTTLIAGFEGQNKKTFEVSGGQAGRINPYNGDFSNIPLNQKMFVQGIDAETGVLITGGRELSLADIVGGGDGSGNGTLNKGLCWDGKTLVSPTDSTVETDSLPTSFVPVTCSPLIDGIFVPSGKGEEPLVLTSDKATLNLDDFIASDTNGLLTLMLLREDSDENAVYWFCSKEAAEGESEKYPTLVFPHASGQVPVQVTTAHKNGADAYVSNDELRSPEHTLGQWPTLFCRYYKDYRVHIVFLRFDISDVKGDLTDAALNLYMLFGNRFREMQVYGLADGPADFWDETTLSYHTAPGLLPAQLGRYTLDTDQVVSLGTFDVTDNRIKTVQIQVNSAKNRLWTPPSTMRQSVGVISNARNYIDDNDRVQSLVLNDIACGTRKNPSILMHANAGVTFDLDAMRRKHGSVFIESFTAVCGISQPTPSENPDHTTVYSSASFYVLVDGREVFNAVDFSPFDEPQEIDIKLNPRSRYLTLVATQGTDNSIANDACVFVNPTLKLK